MLKAEVNGMLVNVEMHGSGVTAYEDVMRLLISIYNGFEGTIPGLGDDLLEYIAESISSGDFVKNAREGTEKM
mgnify:CR=1 FL=1